jgi:hypothetical protein
MVHGDLIRARRELAEAVTPAQAGGEAIYRERPILMIVRIESIRVTDEGLRARMVPSPAPGIPLVEDPPPWDIGAPWDIVSVSSRKWYAMYLNWTVCFDVELLRDLRALGEQFEEAEGPGERWRRLNESFDAHETRLVCEELERELEEDAARPSES